MKVAPLTRFGWRSKFLRPGNRPTRCLCLHELQTTEKLQCLWRRSHTVNGMLTLVGALTSVLSFRTTGDRPVPATPCPASALRRRSVALGGNGAAKTVGAAIAKTA